MSFLLSFTYRFCAALAREVPLMVVVVDLLFILVVKTVWPRMFLCRHAIYDLSRMKHVSFYLRIPTFFGTALYNSLSLDPLLFSYNPIKLGADVAGSTDGMSAKFLQLEAHVGGILVRYVINGNLCMSLYL